jgi:hypothetical protein
MTIIPKKRNLPFLRRNWSSGVNRHQNMGATLSSPTASGGKGDFDGDEARAQKRRRLDSSISKTDTQLIAEGTLFERLLIAGKAGSGPRYLHIEIVKISHKDASRVKHGNIDDNGTFRDMSGTRTRCKITLTHSDGGGAQVLHCQSQICLLKGFKTPVGPYRAVKILLPNTFDVPEESFLINRDDDDAFRLADNYNLMVELEAAGDVIWPPLDFAALQSDPYNRDLPARRWILAGSYPEICTNRSQPSATCILNVKQPGKAFVETEYQMEIKYSWDTGCKGTAKPLEKGVLPSITVHDPDNRHHARPEANGQLRMPAEPQISLPNGHSTGSGDLDEDDEETTPSRALRTRESKVYNLKVLSDKAQGKERKRRKRILEQEPGREEDGRVLYYLPAEQVGLDSYRCVTCGCPHQSLWLLRAHHETNHPEYEYDLQSTKGGALFRVTHRYEYYPFPGETYQLGLPTKTFDLDRFASGDLTWVNSRLGPDNEIGSMSPVAKATVSKMPYQVCISATLCTM